MVTRTVVCPDCGETVPYGRLSCAACGSLLAAVAGAPRRSEPLAAVAVTEAPTLDDVAIEEAPPPPPVARGRARSGRRHEAAAAADDAPLALATPAHDDDAPVASATAEPERAHAPVGGIPPVLHDWPGDATLPVAADAHRFEDEQTWDGDDEPAAVPSAQPPHPAAAGAYVPPSTLDYQAVDGPGSTVLTPAATPAVAGGPAFVRTAAAPMRPFGASIQVAPTGEEAAAPARSKPLRAGDAPLLADLPFDAPDTLTGWLVAAGSGLASLSFLLPWVGGVADYFNAWGLAVPSRILPMAAGLALLWLSMTPNRLPAWLRSAVLPLVLGGLLFGLVWSSVFGNRAALGVLVAAVAALLLVIGGAMNVRPARHAEADTAV